MLPIGEVPNQKKEGLTFNRWLYTVLVRPFSEFIPEIVKKIYHSLELEDPVIEIDLERASRKRPSTQLASKKRKLSLNGESDPP